MMLRQNIISSKILLSNPDNTLVILKSSFNVIKCKQIQEYLSQEYVLIHYKPKYISVCCKLALIVPF